MIITRYFHQNSNVQRRELSKILSREQQEESILEYSTLQTLKTKNIVVSIPLRLSPFLAEKLEESTRKQVLEDPEIWQNALGSTLTPQGLVMPVMPQYQGFPWVAVAGRRVFSQLETIFSDRYFMVSSELNFLNTILLEDPKINYRS